MPYLTIGESRIYFEQHGAGPSLVLLHGVGGNHASWFAQIAGLSHRWRLTTLDLRGFGNSADVEQSGRESFADDLVTIWHELRLEGSVLIGQSMGGGAAMAFAAEHAARLRALVVADSLVGLELPPVARERMAVAEAATADLPQVERVLGSRVRTAMPERVALYQQLASFNSVNLRTLKGAPRRVTLESLERSGLPILFIAGQEDVLFPPQAVRAVHERLANSSYAEIEGAGHSAHFEDPDAFNLVLSDWLERLACPR
ncbi:alpha/beta fold hydrolase [Variovorax boronicumulans]|uniref:alpha/beta fold hydrolase n=1 Tax=Variovorax boronicumulans TaxID=436515 RepID=UPI0012FE2AB9|nr:alpha/beta hydrolase [Variovorax boronicumulans]